MSKNNCEVIKDLLPLYADDVCSEESRKIVAEHIANCSECRSDIEKMGRTLSIGAENDIKVMKRIKQRMQIEKCVVAVIAVILAFVISVLCIGAMETYVPIDYAANDLDDNLWVEEDDNGDLWLVKKGAAAESGFVYPTLRDANGNYMNGSTKNEFDRESVEAYGVTLQRRRVYELFDSEMINNEERSLLFNINEKDQIDEVFYYDKAENKEYILWERD